MRDWHPNDSVCGGDPCLYAAYVHSTVNGPAPGSQDLPTDGQVAIPKSLLVVPACEESTVRTHRKQGALESHMVLVRLIKYKITL